MEKELTIAFLITAYRQPGQLARLINCLGRKTCYEDIYVHLDKKSKTDPEQIGALTHTGVHYYSQYKVYWGGFNQLLSILFLAERALEKKDYDFIILLSEQDLPVVSYERLAGFLSENKDRSFITLYKFPIGFWHYKHGFGRVEWYWFMDHISVIRGIDRMTKWSHSLMEKYDLKRASSRGIEFYGGSDWWMLPGEVVRYCLKRFRSDQKIRQCFKYSFIPTEMALHTLIGNSSYRESVTNDNRRYIAWSEGSTGHPDVISDGSVKMIEEGEYLFARKFDVESHPDIYNYFESKF